jgi:DNA-directed RNA polymerase subunit E'/Rpb7
MISNFFFNSININLTFNFISDENDKIWYWNYNDHKFYYDIGEDVKLKIYDIKYKTSNEINKNFNSNYSGINYNSSNSKINFNSTSINNTNSNINNIISIDINSDFINKNEKFCFENFIEILGSFNQEGLGPNKWWQ